MSNVAVLYYPERTTTREKAMNLVEINAKLFPFRKFYLMGKVSDEMQEGFCASLEAWNHDGREPVTLLIDSCGGSLFAGNWVADAISFSASPVHATVTGAAESSAFTILQACHRRSAYPLARLMFHYGSISNLNLDAVFDPVEFVRKSLKIANTGLDKLVARSGKSSEQIRMWAHESRRFSASEALELNFLDEILTPPAR